MQSVGRQRVSVACTACRAKRMRVSPAPSVAAARCISDAWGSVMASSLSVILVRVNPLSVSISIQKTSVGG